MAWASSNPAAATVDGTGKVTAVGAGNATITAASEGRSAGTRVIVGAWARSELLTVDGAALPAVVFSRQVTGSEGVARTISFQVTSGMLRTLEAGGRYELYLDGWLSTDGSPSVQAMYSFVGRFVRDLDGSMILNVDGGAFFRGRVLADGRISVTLTLSEAGTAPVTLVFTAP